MPGTEIPCPHFLMPKCYMTNSSIILSLKITLVQSDHFLSCSVTQVSSSSLFLPSYASSPYHHPKLEDNFIIVCKKNLWGRHSSKSPQPPRGGDRRRKGMEVTHRRKSILEVGRGALEKEWKKSKCWGWHAYKRKRGITLVWMIRKAGGLTVQSCMAVA